MATSSDVVPADMEWIGGALGDWHNTHRWSSWGYTPSPARMQKALWQEVTLQVAFRIGGKPVGLAQLADLNLGDGRGLLELLLDPEHSSGLEDSLLGFIDRGFASYPLRKLSVWVVEDEIELPDFLKSRLEHVGQLRDHVRRSRDCFVSLELFDLWDRT